MTQPTVTDSSPLRVLFPQYRRIDSMVRGELEGLDGAALDWRSDRYGWSGWSMRQQASHLGSLVFRWLLVRWREQLFPDGIPVSPEEMRQLDSPEYDRRLDERAYHEIEDIFGVVDRAIYLARQVLQQRTVAEGRTLVVRRPPSPQWAMMTQAHPQGATGDASGGGTMTLEATFRHMLYEYLTHMYNMQRMKRALGLPVIVRLPDEGYHTLPGWDTSEAEPGSERYE